MNANVDPDSLIKADGTGGPARVKSGVYTMTFGPANATVAVPDVWFVTASSVRRDPRFAEFVRAIGLVDFWRQNGWPDRCRPVGSAVQCD